jgi:ankyrin repeat protein
MISRAVISVPRLMSAKDTVMIGVLLTRCFPTVMHHHGTEYHHYHPSQDDKFRKCRNALFLTNPEIDRASLVSLKGERVSGTCEWIKGNDKYDSWRTGDKNFLWISGGPGKGKTLLSIFLTQELEKKEQTVYYFCASNDQNRNTAKAVLRGLIWQVTGRCVHSAEHLLEDLDDPTRMQSTLDCIETLWSIFVKIFQDTQLGTTFCVLDGLDELDEDSQAWLITKLVSISHTSGSSQLKLVVISRYVLGLENVVRVNLDPDNDVSVGRDIQLFVTARVDELDRRHGFTSEFRGTIEDTLLKRAEGTFLWVGFAMVELLRKQTLTQIKNSLSALPKGLPAIYSRMLLQICPEFRAISLLLLHWVTMAASPLSLTELAAATDTQPLEDIDIEQAISDRVTLCGPLLEIRETKVYLVHQSAKDYLLRQEPHQDPVLEMFRINTGKVHLQMVLRCLTFLEKSDLQDQPISESELSKPGFEDFDPKSSPLLNYAIYNWPHHARLASTPEVYLIRNRGFFEDKSILRQRWWQVYTERGWYRVLVQHPLHMACFLGVVAWVQQILGAHGWKPDFINSKDEYGKSPLSWAAENGRETTVKLLLGTGRIEVDLKDKLGQTSLSWAAKNRQESIVELILATNQADVNSIDEWGQTPLLQAAKIGDNAIAKLLLDTGKANVDWKDEDRQTPLSRAAENGHAAIVKLLLETGKVEIDSKDKWGQTPLLQAAKNGEEAIVKLLLHTGKIDVDWKDENRQTSLSRAAENGHAAIVKLLLETDNVDVDWIDKFGDSLLSRANRKGDEAIIKLLMGTGKVKVDLKDNSGKTLLLQAAEYKNESIVKLLLDDGKVNVDQKDEWGQTPLLKAAENGDESMVKLLLETGKVNLDWKDNSGRTPLSRAAEEGHEAVVKQLLHTGKADADSKDKSGRTPLTWAVVNGHEAIVELLLDTGKVDVDWMDKNGQTPLSRAAENEQEAIIKLLLDTGKVNVDWIDRFGYSLLSRAAKNGDEPTVKLLLDTDKVDVNSENRLGKTALSRAAEKGHEAIVKQLLETANANVDSKDTTGRTPLSWAAERGREATVKMLLDTGKVDANSKDKDGRTPLSWAVANGHEAIALLLDTGKFKVDCDWIERCGHSWL